MGRVRRAAVFRIPVPAYGIRPVQGCGILMVMGRGGWNETGWNNGECGN